MLNSKSILKFGIPNIYSNKYHEFDSMHIFIDYDLFMENSLKVTNCFESFTREKKLFISKKKKEKILSLAIRKYFESYEKCMAY